MSQLERLARKVPPRYVKPPPQGSFGSYVPHYIINQIALAIVGPFTWKIREFIYGADGTTIEGCVGFLQVEIDGKIVEVEEVGDCERPDNWKTNGQRAKDAASDAFKRCWMRESLGLHLRNEETYFLYDQLTGKNLERAPSAVLARDIGPSQSSEVVEGLVSASTAVPPASEPSAASVPALAVAAGVSDTTQSEAPAAISASRMQRAKSRVGALLAAKVSVADERTKRLLPVLNDEIGLEEFELWCVMLDDLEAKLPV